MEMKFCPYCGRRLEGVPNYDCWYCPDCKIGFWGSDLALNINKLLDRCSIKNDELNKLFGVCSNEIRCNGAKPDGKKCNTKLAEFTGDIQWLSIKCPKCNHTNQIQSNT